MDKKNEKLDAALSWARHQHRAALIRKRAAGEPRDPFRGKPGQEEAFAAAAQDAAVTATIVEELDRARRAQAKRPRLLWEYLLLFLVSCAAVGSGAVAGLGMYLLNWALGLPPMALPGVLAALTLAVTIWKRRG